MAVSLPYIFLWGMGIVFVVLPHLNLGLLSDYKICGDSECESLVSRVQAIRDHHAKDCRFLSFRQGTTILVYHKLTGKRDDLWAGSIDKQFGYFLKDAVREEQVYATTEKIVQTQKSDFFCMNEFGYPIDSSHLDSGVDDDDSDQKTPNQESEAIQNSPYPDDTETGSPPTSEDASTESPASAQEPDGASTGEENKNDSGDGAGTQEETPKTPEAPNEQGGSSSSSWFSSSVTGWLGPEKDEEPGSLPEEGKKDENKEAPPNDSFTSSVSGWLGLGGGGGGGGGGGEPEDVKDSGNGQEEEKETADSFTSSVTGWLGLGGEGAGKPDDVKDSGNDQEEEEKETADSLTSTMTGWLGFGGEEKVKETNTDKAAENFRSRRLALDLEANQLQVKEEKEMGTLGWLGNGLSSTLGLTNQQPDTPEAEEVGKEEEEQPASKSWLDLGITDMLGYGVNKDEVDETRGSGFKTTEEDKTSEGPTDSENVDMGQSKSAMTDEAKTELSSEELEEEAVTKHDSKDTRETQQDGNLPSETESDSKVRVEADINGKPEERTLAEREGEGHQMPQSAGNEGTEQGEEMKTASDTDQELVSGSVFNSDDLKLKGQYTSEAEEVEKNQLHGDKTENVDEEEAEITKQIDNTGESTGMFGEIGASGDDGNSELSIEGTDVLPTTLSDKHAEESQAAEDSSGVSPDTAEEKNEPSEDDRLTVDRSHTLDITDSNTEAEMHQRGPEQDGGTFSPRQNVTDQANIDDIGLASASLETQKTAAKSEADEDNLEETENTLKPAQQSEKVKESDWKSETEADTGGELKEEKKEEKGEAQGEMEKLKEEEKQEELKGLEEMKEEGKQNEVKQLEELKEEEKHIVVEEEFKEEEKHVEVKEVEELKEEEKEEQLKEVVEVKEGGKHEEVEEVEKLKEEEKQEELKGLKEMEEEKQKEIKEVEEFKKEEKQEQLKEMDEMKEDGKHEEVKEVERLNGEEKQEEVKREEEMRKGEKHVDINEVEKREEVMEVKEVKEEEKQDELKENETHKVADELKRDEKELEWRTEEMKQEEVGQLIKEVKHREAEELKEKKEEVVHGLKEEEMSGKEEQQEVEEVKKEKTTESVDVLEKEKNKLTEEAESSFHSPPQSDIVHEKGTQDENKLPQFSEAVEKSLTENVQAGEDRRNSYRKKLQKEKKQEAVEEVKIEEKEEEVVGNQQAKDMEDETKSKEEEERHDSSSAHEKTTETAAAETEEIERISDELDEDRKWKMKNETEEKEDNAGVRGREQETENEPAGGNSISDPNADQKQEFERTVDETPDESSDHPSSVETATTEKTTEKAKSGGAFGLFKNAFSFFRETPPAEIKELTDASAGETSQPHTSLTPEQEAESSTTSSQVLIEDLHPDSPALGEVQPSSPPPTQTPSHPSSLPLKPNTSSKHYKTLLAHMSLDETAILAELFGRHKLQFLDYILSRSESVTGDDDESILLDVETLLHHHMERLVPPSVRLTDAPQEDEKKDGTLIALQKLAMLLGRVRETFNTGNSDISKASLQDESKTTGDFSLGLDSRHDGKERDGHMIGGMERKGGVMKQVLDFAHQIAEDSSIHVGAVRELLIWLTVQVRGENRSNQSNTSLSW